MIGGINFTGLVHTIFEEEKSERLSRTNNNHLRDPGNGGGWEVLGIAVLSLRHGFYVDRQSKPIKSLPTLLAAIKPTLPWKSVAAKDRPAP